VNECWTMDLNDWLRTEELGNIGVNDGKFGYKKFARFAYRSVNHSAFFDFDHFLLLLRLSLKPFRFNSYIRSTIYN
jgi:hypothetical protein